MSTTGSTLSKIVAKRIEQAILAAGYHSQDQFANEIGLSRGTLARVLACAVDARLSTVQKIAEGVGVPPHQLLGWDPAGPAVDGATCGLKLAGKPVDRKIVIKIQIPHGIETPLWLKSARERGGVQESPREQGISKGVVKKKRVTKKTAKPLKNA